MASNQFYSSTGTTRLPEEMPLKMTPDQEEDEGMLPRGHHRGDNNVLQLQPDSDMPPMEESLDSGGLVNESGTNHGDTTFRFPSFPPSLFRGPGSPWQRAMMLNKTSKRLCFVSFLLGILIFSLVVAWIATSKRRDSGPVVCEEHACVEAASQILKFIDPKVDPCQDFHKFACGRWLNSARIPYGESSLSSFQMLGDRMNDDLVNLFAKTPKNRTLRKIHKIVQTFFESCMDTVSIDQRGLDSMTDNLRKLQAFDILVKGGLPTNESTNSSIDETTATATATATYNESKARLQFAEDIFNLTHISMVSFFYGVEATRDAKNLTRNVIKFKLNGCNIKEIYATDTEFTRKFIQAYKTLVNQTTESLRNTEFFRDLDANGIHDFCNEMSKIERPAEWLRDPENSYNPHNLSDLANHCTLMNVTKQIEKLFMFANVTVFPNDIVILEHPRIVYSMCGVLSSFLKTAEKRKALYDFIFFKIFQAYVKFLPEFYFAPLITFTRTVTGVQGHTERSKKCQVLTSEDFLTELVGMLYIKEYFPDFTRNYVVDMIGNIQKVATELLKEARWMEEGTKQKAIDKVKTMTIDVGYKEQLMDISQLEKAYNFSLSSNRFLDNVIQIYTTLTRDDYARLRSTEKEEWRPQEVNAFYDPRRNNIVVPVGILQGVFFNKGFPAYMNYGGIGVVLGHELGHGFDDSGRKFDYSGLLKEWWDPQTSRNYENKTECFLNQYNNYSIYGYHVNGNKTMGENIADNMGIKLAFRAFQQHARNSIPPGRLPGLLYSPEQIFFISFAHIWCSLATKEYTISNILSDEHAPDKFRISGTVSNSYEFAKAFHCPAGSPMNPHKKCSVV